MFSNFVIFANLTSTNGISEVFIYIFTDIEDIFKWEVFLYWHLSPNCLSLIFVELLIFKIRFLEILGRSLCNIDYRISLQFVSVLAESVGCLAEFIFV